MAELIVPALLETVYMVFFSTIFSLVIGFPLGILLVITEKDGIWERPNIYRVLDGIINILRSFPFIILMILLFPLSRIIVGSSIGTTATIVPLSIAAAPFVARLIEGSLKEVDKGIIESSLAMGSNVREIVFKVLIPESMPSLITSITTAIINLIGYAAMAGAIGGGGLGDVAIRYGLYRFQRDTMIGSVIVIIILVQGVQFIGNKLSIKIDKK